MNILLGIIMAAQIILLNGPSTSGKSTIQKAVQKKADYLKIGIDGFFDALIEEPDISQPTIDQYTHSGEYIRGVETTMEGEHPVVTLKVGPAGDRIIYGMHRAIAAYASVGNCVIVDYILYNPEWAADLEETLKPFDVLYVKVNAPLEVLEKRERERGTSPCGHARSHYGHVHNGMHYDLELDTSQLSPEQCADLILEKL